MGSLPNKKCLHNDTQYNSLLAEGRAPLARTHLTGTHPDAPNAAEMAVGKNIHPEYVLTGCVPRPHHQQIRKVRDIERSVLQVHQCPSKRAVPSKRHHAGTNISGSRILVYHTRIPHSKTNSVNRATQPPRKPSGRCSFRGVNIDIFWVEPRFTQCGDATRRPARMFVFRFCSRAHCAQQLSHIGKMVTRWSFSAVHARNQPGVQCDQNDHCNCLQSNENIWHVYITSCISQNVMVTSC